MQKVVGPQPNRRLVSAAVSMGSTRRVQFLSRHLLGRHSALLKVAPEALGDDGDGGRTLGESELQASDEPGNAGSARDAALLGSLTHEVLEHETVGSPVDL